MKLELLENIDSPVALQIVPLFDIEQRPEYPIIAAAISELSNRIEAKSPLAAITRPYAAFHQFGSVPGPQVGEDTLSVYVGFETDNAIYGLAAPGGYSASGFIPRLWGGSIGLNLDKIQSDGVDIATVVRHEFGHVLGLPHSVDSVALMGAYIGTESKNLNHSDANALDASGWYATPISHIPGHSRVFGVGTTSNGWIVVENDEVARFPSYVRVPDGGSWGYAPKYEVLTPL